MPFALVFLNLRRHWMRTALTLGSIVVAIFLACFLRGLVHAIHGGVQGASSDRLAVQSAVSLFVNLPVSYHNKIAQIEGVERVCKLQWFGGYYQDPDNFFAQFAVSHEQFFDTYPEVQLIEGSREDFETKRTSCVIGRGLAESFDWKVGDTIPLTGTLFQRNDGVPWELEVAGIYSARLPIDERTIFFHFDYLEKSLEEDGASGPLGVSVYVVDKQAGADEIRVLAAIEELFENGPQRVLATTEAEFNRQFVSMLGNVPKLMNSIGGGVLFAILLATLNTMLLAARERTHEIGILKALGFNDATNFGLLLCESLLIGALGGLLGLGLALATEPGIAYGLAAMFPGYHIPSSTAWSALGFALLIGLIAGLVPAWSASRLKAVEALRDEG